MQTKTNTNLNTVKFLKILFSLSPKESVLIIFLHLLSSVTEGMGFALLLPLLSLSDSDSTNIDHGSFAMVHYVIPENISLESILVLFSVALISFALVSYYRTIFLTKAECIITCAKQEQLFRSIAESKLTAVLTQRKSNLTELLMTESKRIGNAYVQASSMMSALLTLFLLIAMACFISPLATLLALMLGLLIVTLTRSLNRQAHKAGEEAYPAYQELYAKCDEHVDSLPLIRIYGATDKFVSNFREASEKLSSITKKFISARAGTALLYRVCIALGLGLSGYVVIHYNILTIAEFVVLGALFSRIVPQITVVHHSYQTLLNSMPSYLASDTAITYFKCNAEDSITTNNEKINPKELDLKNSVVFTNVGFQYDESLKSALADVSLKLIPHGVVLVTGASGSGKSTFAGLLAGLLSPTKGFISIGDEIISGSNRQALWRNIGYVPQETILPFNTLRHSLLLAKPTANDSEIWSVLDKVRMRSVVENLPNKLDTILGDQGCMLSGGERQRLALARALLSNPKIIILDEATNALDRENEEAIFSTLESYREQSLIVLISHQNIHLTQVDQWLYFERGTCSVIDPTSKLQFGNFSAI